MLQVVDVIAPFLFHLFLILLYFMIICSCRQCKISTLVVFFIVTSCFTYDRFYFASISYIIGVNVVDDPLLINKYSSETEL